ncbi:MAG: type II restriction endonuclease [Candidatus Dadabacteria bacterium]|nr:type II restriction endonuclease [Candidatus Dadabacteria bacterium]MDE0520308.1 type II restriction endonuclease [Candidatus Dadabacteria bacterium]MDE0662386.1 type II restriction endonuclease [Candidatus Dadabacteria bacterium]
MKFGILSDFFEGVGAKYLTEVEINKLRSNQHEFQGVSSFRRFLGKSAEKIRFPSTFHWLDDEEDREPASSNSFCTWSDVRRNNPARSAEYHLYYSAESEAIVHRAKVGDLLVIAKTREQNLHVMLCPANTTIARQLLWLFGLDLMGRRVEAKILGTDEGIHLGYSVRAILDGFGIELEAPKPPDALGELIARYGDGFPGTAEFSGFARDTLPDVDPVGAPDETLAAWMDHEEVLFRHLERYIIADQIRKNFVDIPDVDDFLRFSLSIQNRRKSRAGWAFGHHVEAILKVQDVLYTREATTEKRRGPDFLFLGEKQYHDPDFDAGLLTMLGVKTSCKDRWRQVLTEANKIEEKHLLTMQPGISEAQTDEMQAERLQLVVPSVIFSSYNPAQQKWLMNVKDFVELVKERQRLGGDHS